ncbi:MAG TPA: YkgJ family cysteine cluster protein [Sunxiuqinia sp.]|nr:YkgJ family cysteine cluster protein [Sunxiuqinia sp.]
MAILTEHEKLFFNDGYQIGREAVSNGFGNQKIMDAIANMYESMDQLIDSLFELAKKQGISIQCKKGCCWCCHQPVFANSHEIQYLSNFIKTNFSKMAIENIRRKAIEKNQQTSKLRQEILLKNKGACPLLKNGTCTAYSARPMACRIYLSTKVKTCIEFYQNPDNENSFPALLDFPLQAGRLMNEGFVAALLESGIESEEFRLEEGLIAELRGKPT